MGVGVFYINGARVSPAGSNYLTLQWDAEAGGVFRWKVRGWEDDVYEEWPGAERLEDE